ncbi:MAG: hypothetical protein IKS15_05695, partial [Opitutales bacterium]|nr:hypothetical protein [Opitutales bacterium]
MKNCLLTPIASILALAAASSFGAAYDYNFTTTLPTNVDWFDVGWEAKETTQSRDRYYVNIINADAANIYIDKGMNADIADSACMYTQGDTRIVIGSPDDTKTTEMHFIHTGGDSFLEVTGRSSIVVRQNGILTLDANRSLRNWSTSNELPSDFIHVLVDGGTFNGNIYTQTPANAGFFNIVFRNGGTLNRNTEVNPLNMNGKSTMTFDNATYNVWNATNTTNNGWGNHVMNAQADNQDYRISVTLKNGAVWNGAGDVEGGAVTYWDFSEDITSAYNSNQKSADLTLQVRRATP